MEKRLTAGGVVRHKETGHIVVVSQKGITWSLPKGGVHEGEEIIDGAKREIAEESGITELELIRELGVYERTKMNRDGSESGEELKEIHIFLFETKQSRLEPTDPKNPEARWVEQDKVEELLSNERDKKFYREARTLF